MKPKYAVEAEIMFRKMKIKFNITISLAMISVFIILFLISDFKYTDTIKNDYINKTLNITAQATDGIAGDIKDTEHLCTLYMDRSGVFDSVGKNLNVNALLRETKSFSPRIDGAALMVDGNLYLSDTYLSNYFNLILNSLTKTGDGTAWEILDREKLFFVCFQKNGTFICDISSGGFFGKKYKDNIFMKDAAAVIEKNGKILSVTGDGEKKYDKYGNAEREYKITDNIMIVGDELDCGIKINYYIPLTGLIENIRKYRIIMVVSILVFAVMCSIAVRIFVNRIAKMMSKLSGEMNSYIEENRFQGGETNVYDNDS